MVWEGVERMGEEEEGERGRSSLLDVLDSQNECFCTHQCALRVKEFVLAVEQI